MAKDKSNKQKKVAQNYKPKAEKNITIENDRKSFYDNHPTWSFSKCDFEHERWGVSCSLGSLDAVLKYLKNLESMTWREILTTTAGRSNNTRNHGIECSLIIKEAQQRMCELNLDEYDVLYSVACSGKDRIWGMMEEGGVYNILWFDRNHEVYPVSKKHT